MLRVSWLAGVVASSVLLTAWPAAAQVDAGSILVKDSFRAAFDLPLESSAITDGLTKVPQVQGQYVVSDVALLDVRYSDMDYDYNQLPQPNAPDGPVRLDFDTGWSGPFRFSELMRRNRSHLRANYTHYLASERQSHSVKLGLSFSRDTAYQGGYVPGGIWYFGPDRVFINNTPNISDVRDLGPPFGGIGRVTELSLYGQDSWRLGSRLTMNLGLRYDRSTGSLPPQQRLDSFFPELGPEFRAATFPAESGVTRWRELQPRLSAVYDLRGDGRWALKASYAGYTSPQAATFLNVNVVGFGEERWTWADANGNGLFDLGEQQTLTRRRFPRQTRFVSRDLQAPVTREATVGIDHELAPGFLLSAVYIRRSAHNLITVEDRGVPFDPITGAPSYELVTRIDPGPDGVLGTSDDGGPVQIFDQVDNLGNNLEYIFNPNERGLPMPQTYDGLEVTFNRRWRDNRQRARLEPDAGIQDHRQLPLAGSDRRERGGILPASIRLSMGPERGFSRRRPGLRVGPGGTSRHAADAIGRPGRSSAREADQPAGEQHPQPLLRCLQSLQRQLRDERR